jgi:dipeptidyl aminopeptidase/acylaminoacyl peptidase
MLRTGLIFTAAALLATAAIAQTPAAAPARVERGQLVLENIPDTPAAVRERLRQFVNTRSASFQDFTPDGGMLIATRFGDAAQLHKVAMPMGARTQLTFYREPVAGGGVRPGGSGEVFFVKDVGGDENFQGFLFNPVTGLTAQVTEPGTRNQGFAISDDGKTIAWARSTRDDPNADILIASADAPHGRRVALEGTGAITPIDFSADGKSLLLGEYVSITKSKRFVLDVQSGAMRELAADLSVSFDGGEFTPDGKGIILVTDEGGDFARIVRLDLASGARTPITPVNLGWDVEAFDVAKDGRTLVYSVNEAGLSKLRLMDLRTGRALPAPDLPAGILGGLGFDEVGGRLGFTLNSATAPSDAFVWDLRARKLTRWTQSEVGGLNPQSFTAPTLIEWPSFDGKKITGFQFLPKGAGPHPVIIQIHGGPEAQYRPGFSPTIQYWVNELGVAVIAPNVRGSTGYGKAFVDLDNGKLREDSVKDIGALLDWIEKQPNLDKSRVIVYGGSYGGYMVLASMVHYNDRLAGGVNIVGISNFVTFLENTAGYRRNLRRVEYGDESNPDMRTFLQTISPLTNARKITKPLFIVHGANDPRVPASEAEQILSAVRSNGGRTWFMLAKDEGHGFAKRPNQEAQREAETLFFNEVFGLKR